MRSVKLLLTVAATCSLVDLINSNHIQGIHFNLDASIDKGRGEGLETVVIGVFLFFCVLLVD